MKWKEQVFAVSLPEDSEDITMEQVYEALHKFGVRIVADITDPYQEFVDKDIKSEYQDRLAQLWPKPL